MTMEIMLMLLGTATGMAALALALALHATRRAQGEIHRRLEDLATEQAHLRKLVVALQNALHHVYDDGHAAQERDQALEERVALLGRQQDQLMMRDTDVGPYFQAIRLASQGSDVANLMARTGVSRGEAELIISLHGQERGSG